MKRTGCIVAAALLLGLLLAGITGYFIWHSAQDKYVRAEMVGVSGGTGVAGVEAPEPEEGDGAETGAAADSDGAQGTDGLQGMDGAQGTDGPDAAGWRFIRPLQTTLKHRGPEQEHQMRTLR